MSTISEVRNDYINEDINVTHIDAWFTEDDGEEGKTIAVVCNDTCKVIFFDNRYGGDEKITTAIAEVINNNLKNEFWVVAWCEKTEDFTSDGEVTKYDDYYHRYDNIEDAELKYRELLNFDVVYSVSFCKETKGSDS